MRKYLIFILTFTLFVGFSFPVNSKAAIADGTYSLQYQVNKPSSSSASMANDYFLKPATLIVKNGKMIMQITINKSDWVTQFNPPGGAKVIATNEAANQRTVQFSVSDAQITTIGMKIDIDDINYHHSYSVDFVFNTESLPEAKSEEPQQTVAPQQQAVPQQPAQQQTTPAQTNPQDNATTKNQSSGSNTSSNKPATPTEKKSTESSSAQTITTTSTDDSTKSVEQEETSSTDEKKAEDSEAVENPETSDELPIFALFLLIVAMIVFICTKQTKTIE